MFQDKDPKGGGLFGNPATGGLFAKKEPHERLEEKGRRNIWKDMNLLFILILILLYPFAVLGAIPFGIVRLANRHDRMMHIDDMDYQGFLNRGSRWFILGAIVGFIVNVCLFLWIPEGYFSSYLLFPLNLVRTKLVFNAGTVMALFFGASGLSLCLLSVSTLYDKLRVNSKEEERTKVRQSKMYKKRREAKFQSSQNFTKDYVNTYETMLEITDYVTFKDTFEQLKKQILLGTDEFGKAYFMPLKELNQHCLIPATTGSGKTTLLQLFIEHCVKFHIPCVLIDGKGAQDTLEAMEEIAHKYGKKVIAFSDRHDVAYNPLKHGNSTEIKDRLVTLAETESVFYSGAAKSLLMGTIQLVDCFGIPRTFSNLSDYFLPRNVLQVFADYLTNEGVKVFEKETEVTTKQTGTLERKTGKMALETREENAGEETLPNEKATTIVQYNPEDLALNTYYELVRKQFDYMTQTQQKIFKQLFIRYEHKDSPFYLYETSEALQTNINMLLDSEVGSLFDTESGKEELDLSETYDRNAFVYVSLNGLIYDEFIKQVAHFIVGDIKHLMSTIYEKTGKRKEMLALFDEPSSYLDDSFIAIANKARGAGLHAIYSPQTLADIERIDEKLAKQLIGNVNTFMLGQTNESEEVSYWAELFGTYKDIDITEVTEQADGFNNLNKQSWTGERGTKREVNKFNIAPDDIKDLRTGEFFILRKGNNVHDFIRKVYVRNALSE